MSMLSDHYKPEYKMTTFQSLLTVTGSKQRYFTPGDNTKETKWTHITLRQTELKESGICYKEVASMKKREL
jgi:hypothetical protein